MVFDIIGSPYRNFRYFSVFLGWMPYSTFSLACSMHSSSWQHRCLELKSCGNIILIILDSSLSTFLVTVLCFGSQPFPYRNGWHHVLHQNWMFTGLVKGAVNGSIRCEQSTGLNDDNAGCKQLSINLLASQHHWLNIKAFKETQWTWCSYHVWMWSIKNNPTVAVLSKGKISNSTNQQELHPKFPTSFSALL